MGKKNKNTLTGAEAFEAYYSELFGERWPGLRCALLGEARQYGYSENLLKTYYLDAGSVRAAKALPLENAERIADFAQHRAENLLLLRQQCRSAQL